MRLRLTTWNVNSVRLRAEQVAQRILGHLHQPMRVDDRTLVVNASIGIATGLTR